MALLKTSPPAPTHQCGIHFPFRCVGASGDAGCYFGAFERSLDTSYKLTSKELLRLFGFDHNPLERLDITCPSDHTRRLLG